MAKQSQKAQTRTWTVNSPLQVAGEAYGVGSEVALTDEVAASIPAGVISLKNETDEQREEREAYEREQRAQTVAQPTDVPGLPSDLDDE